MIPKLNKYHEHSKTKINFSKVTNDMLDVPNFSHKIENAPSIFISNEKEIVDQFVYYNVTWCYNNLGYRTDIETTPEIDWSFKNKDMQKTGVLGYYHHDQNFIELRIQGHRTWVNLSNTIIHEWIHYLQSSLWYSRYSNVYKYDKNPYEIMAQHYAAVNCNKCANFCWRKIKNE